MDRGISVSLEVRVVPTLICALIALLLLDDQPRNCTCVFRGTLAGFIQWAANCGQLLLVAQVGAFAGGCNHPASLDF